MLPILVTAFKGLLALTGLVALVVAYMWHFKNIKSRDWRFMFRGLALKRFQKSIAQKNTLTHEVWEKMVKKSGRDAPAFVFEGRTYSMGEIDDEANRFANWMVTGAGLKKDDTIALLMENRPMYMSIWMGASKVGVRVALINTNIRLETLAHSVAVADAKALLFAAELNASVAEVADTFKSQRVQLWRVGDTSDSKELLGENVQRAVDAASAQAPAQAVSARALGMKASDTLLFIYTSGTTGKPKAARITHSRFLSAACGFSLFGELSPRDRVYCCLPMYHSAAGVVGLGTLIMRGAVVVLKKKFSRRAFWPDIRDNRCTVVQYIGEICRYTLAEPPTPQDATHSLRLALGNGMRPDVWRTWQQRFGVPKIMEFYAATEGVGALLNSEGKENAIGFISPLVSFLFPSKIFKFDMQTEEPVRDPKTGLCIEAGPNEAGEFMARIQDVAGIRNYQGYSDEKESNKKVLRNVMKKGDEWFRSGDLLRKDKEGFVYFVDRIGDTFRWKSENVATTQVAEVMTLCDCLKNAQVNVYGVEIPGNDGRCGMAAIGLEGGAAKVDFDALAKHVIKHLPQYSRPHFLRFVPQMDTTGTFKYKKVELRNEGFNPSAVKDDALYFLHPDKGQYLPIDAKEYEHIMAGVYRF